MYRARIMPLILIVIFAWGIQLHRSALPTAFRKEPYLIFNGKNTEMKLLWQLDTTASATLEWGTDPSVLIYSATTQEYNEAHQHAYTIQGLLPGGRYFYRVTAEGVSASGSFLAAPPGDAARVNLFAYGDTRTNADIHNQVAGEVVKTFRADPSYQTLVLSVGDLVSDGDQEARWTDEFFHGGLGNIRAMLANAALVSARGNHEGSGRLFAQYFPMPYVSAYSWSFDYGPVHVAAVDQYTDYGQGSAQYYWLENDLKTSSKQWKIILLHEPGWSAGGGHANNRTVQEDLQPLAKQYGVALVIAGHNHYYARAVVDEVQHLTVGGGGAPQHTPNMNQPNLITATKAYSFLKISIDGNSLSGTAVKIDGSVIDTFTVPTTEKVFLPVMAR